MFEWFTEESKRALEAKYFLPGEDVQGACRRIARRAAQIYPQIPDFENKLYEMLAKGWIAPSSPVWANFGAERGMPISCFSSSISDSIESILDTHNEVCMLTKMGGGTAGYFGNLRAKNSPISGGGTTNGPVAFMQMFDTAMRVVSQSNVRRGSFAAYLPIDHPDIEDFLRIKDKGNPIQDMSFAVTVPDSFMNAVLARDPKSMAIWAKVLEARKERGMPYVIFIDQVNRKAPDVYKDKGLKITHSNLCAEIYLNTDENKTFVCCLTAMNLDLFDEWKDTEAVEYCTYLLDAVMEEFIHKAEGVVGLERALNFAKQERALGVGATGWHSLLKQKMIPFDSLQARYLTVSVFELIKNKTLRASKQLAEWFGEPELLQGYGRRNSTLTAIAPNTSSGEIIGVSQGIEPDRSNYFTKETAWGIIPGKKCKYLKKLLDSKGKDTPEVWESILEWNGSVQHLDFLSDKEKAVFKTFWEINQYELLNQAGIRQEYIDQGQSLNIFVPPGVPAKEINALHIHAWQAGVKALYYQRSEHKNIWKDTRANCSSCEG